MKRLLISFLFVMAVVGLGFLTKMQRSSPVESPPLEVPVAAPLVTSPQNPQSQEAAPKTEAEASPMEVQKASPAAIVPSAKAREPEPPKTLRYRVVDGLAVVDGDIVLGEPQGGGETGHADAPRINLWSGGELPFAINPNVTQPQRVIEALTYFIDTPIRIVPYTDQEDVLVFQSGAKGCKSYVGRVGGKQPVWISEECSPAEIAHEVMHALGFIHEQNRTDRDSYVQVLKDNVQSGYEINFEMFPSSMMTLSGAGAFDFRSIMLYAPTSFSKNGQETLKSKKSEHEIAPSKQLSAGDVLRLQQVYGN